MCAINHVLTAIKTFRIGARRTRYIPKVAWSAFQATTIHGGQTRAAQRVVKTLYAC
jgi:hypothetical protein